MYSDKVVAGRARMIENMRRNIEEIRPTGIHIVITSIVLFPAFLALIVRNLIYAVWGLIKYVAVTCVELLIAPFAALYAFFDLTLISYWYVTQINIKLSRKL